MKNSEELGNNCAFKIENKSSDKKPKEYEVIMNYNKQLNMAMRQN